MRSDFYYYTRYVWPTAEPTRLIYWGYESLYPYIRQEWLAYRKYATRTELENMEGETPNEITKAILRQAQKLFTVSLPYSILGEINEQIT